MINAALLNVNKRDQIFGSHEGLVPAEQQPQLVSGGAALPTGAEHLPLLDRGETALHPTCSYGVFGELLVRFSTNRDLRHKTYGRKLFKSFLLPLFNLLIDSGI